MFGQNWVSSRWNDVFVVLLLLLLVIQKTYIWILFNIRSVTAEILLHWVSVGCDGVEVELELWQFLKPNTQDVCCCQEDRAPYADPGGDCSADNRSPNILHPPPPHKVLPPPSYQVLFNPLHTRYSPYENSVRKERGIRKREVLLSRLSVYIVVLMVSCHAVRIIPTIWEIIMTVTDQADITQATKTWLWWFITGLQLASVGGHRDLLLPPRPRHLLLLLILYLLLQIWL